MIGRDTNLNSSLQGKGCQHPNNSFQIGEEVIETYSVNSNLGVSNRKNTQNTPVKSDQINQSQYLQPDLVNFPDVNFIKPPSSFNPISEWEGYIDSIEGSEFTVKMVNLESKIEIPTDLATFSMEDVSEDDRHLVKEGAIIRWVIGYERLISGQVRKISVLHLRRLPVHSDKDYERALIRARELLDGINWEYAPKSR